MKASVLRLAQAFAHNRPHLVHKGCLTPFVPAAEYAARRIKILEGMRPGSVAIFPGNDTHYASGGVFYKFRQDPNLQYLVGAIEPSACLVLQKPASNGVDSSRQLLFVEPKDPTAERWEGERVGPELATELFGIETLSRDKLESFVERMIGAADIVYVDSQPSAVARAPRFFTQPFLSKLYSRSTVYSSSPLVDPVRAVKSENEIDCLRRACEISALAFNQAYTMPFASEHDLHAFLEFEFRVGGCESEAYLAVVAGGAHALTIHYVRNDDLLRDGELVLVDAGGRYGGYCADISRAWPVNGKFSGPQRDLYEAVLNVNKACIDKCAARENMSLYDLHRFSEGQLRTELANIGLCLSQKLLREVYPHMIGHNLGLDVHDGPATTRPLQVNQVVTIEPGVYFPIDDRIPKHFQGIGIRIEDNVVVGRDAPEILTIDCKKEICDLERAS